MNDLIGLHDTPFPLNPYVLAELFPALEEVGGGHLGGLEELVDGDGQLEGDVLQGSPVPGETGRTR